MFWCYVTQTKLKLCLPRSIELLHLEHEWFQASCRHDKHAEPFSLALLLNCCCCCRAFLRASRLGSPSPLLWMCETLHRLIFRLLSLPKPMARGISSPTQTLCPTAQSLLSWRSASLASSSRMLSRRKASQFWTTPRSALETCCCCNCYTLQLLWLSHILCSNCCKMPDISCNPSLPALASCMS